jgi:DNA polymerase-3 subunit epsilon
MKDLGALLRLERPLAVLDLETTGVNPDIDRVIQISVTMFRPESQPTRWSTFIDPEMAIPAEIQHKVKITDADVAGKPTFRELAAPLARKFQACDYSGYNVDFDLRFTKAEMKRAGVEWDWDGAAVVDAQDIYRRFHPRTLSDFYREYADPDFDGSGAHDAGFDVEMTIDGLAGALERHAEAPRTVAELAAWLRPQNPSWVDRSGKIVWRNKVAAIGFGKQFNGTTLQSMVEACGCRSSRHDRGCPKGYLEWMIGADFPTDTKIILKRALAGDYPKWVPRG